MIKPGFIAKQVDKSRRARATTRLLQDLVFSVVDIAANNHYKDEYPIKCLQTSAAVELLLNGIGIRAGLFGGAVCVGEVYANTDEIGWGGFWDRDHHVWVVTEFDEFVDLSISQLHRHPASRRKDAIPVPAVWWSDPGRWPAALRYLLDSPIGIQLEEHDTADLRHFLGLCQTLLQRMLRDAAPDEISFAPVVRGPESLNELYQRGNAWAVRGLVFQERGVQLPKWIADRQLEMDRAHRGGTRAPSRLNVS